MLITINNVLSKDELATARSLLADAKWNKGQITAGIQAAQVKNNLQLMDGTPQIAALRTLVLDAINRSALFFSAALPLKIMPPFFNRYTGESNAYGPHTDCAMRRVEGKSVEYVRSDISATLFFSEPDSYEGGLLNIQDTFGTHGIKLSAGSLVLYPSSSLHEVTPVTRGERLASFMFIQSMVRDAEQRRLLYEMDMALLTLRNEVGDTPPIVQLTGSYHNLLRRWAEN